MSAAHSIVRSVYHASRSCLGYFKSRKILRDYLLHYERAQKVYGKSGQDERLIKSITETGVRISIPRVDDNLVDFENRYFEIIDRLAADVAEKLEDIANCFFLPKLESIPGVTRTSDHPAVKAGDVISAQLKECLGLEGLNELCAIVLPQIERKVYGCDVVVDKVYIYRNLVSRLEDQISWRWHYDNHPNEILKIMIYLTDVSESAGPFEYLRSTTTRKAFVADPRPLAADTLITRPMLERYGQLGFEPHKVVGPKGTLVLFDNNTVHKANMAKTRHRDVIVMQIRPSLVRRSQYIGREWTGSFPHVDFSPDPAEHRPINKVMISG